MGRAMERKGENENIIRKRKEQKNRKEKQEEKKLSIM
jgi:hypothetical protein